MKFTDPTGETIYVNTEDPTERRRLLDDLNYTYGCAGCVTITKDNTLAIDTSKVQSDVLKAAQFLTDAITSQTYEAAVSVKNGSDDVTFGASIKQGAVITDSKGTRKIDAIYLDFKDRDALIGSQDAKDAFAKLTFAHEVAHLYPVLLEDPKLSDGTRKTGPVVDATNKIAQARGILLRATYYGQQDEASQYFGYIYMGSPQVDKKTNQLKVKSEKLVRWNRLLIKGMN